MSTGNPVLSRTAVLSGTGFYPDIPPSPIVDQVNFITRVRTPVLMLNGQYDTLVPLSLQDSFFRMLGTPAGLKKHIKFPCDHTIPVPDRKKATLEWLDERFGPTR